MADLRYATNRLVCAVCSHRFRDSKLENILLDCDNRMKPINFTLPLFLPTFPFLTRPFAP